jgi:hypothetical protein
VGACSRDAGVTRSAPGEDAAVGPSAGRDAGLASSGFALGFAARVRSVVLDAGTPSTCASPLPSLPVGTPDGARLAVRQFIAGVLDVGAEQLDVTVHSCAAGAQPTCAQTFQHDIYKSNGAYGELLYPLAQELETNADFVEETIWVPTVNGITAAADVCVSGVVDGTLSGVVMFNDRQDCP